MYCFEQSQHLLMRSDLTGVVSRLGTAKRLVFQKVDLKQFNSITSEVINHKLGLSGESVFFFLHISAMFLSLFLSMFVTC